MQSKLRTVTALGFALGLGSPCHAILFGMETTDFPCVVQVVDANGQLTGTGVFVSKRKMITADHVPGNRIKIGLTTFVGTRMSAPAVGEKRPDLAVLCFDEDIVQDFCAIDSNPVANGTTVCIVGYGPSTSSSTSPYQITPDPVAKKRKANNIIDTTTTIEDETYKDDTYCIDLDPSSTGIPGEGISVPSDSGGAMLAVSPDGSTRLIGMLIAGTVDTEAVYGDQSYASMLKNNKQWIDSVPEPSIMLFGGMGLASLMMRIRRK